MEQPDQSIVRSTVRSPIEQPTGVVQPQDRPMAAARPKENPDPGRKEISRSVAQDQAIKALGNVKLSISIDETKELPVIKIFDSESGKELLQVPAEHSLNISRTIKAAVGAIFDKKA